MEYQIQENCLTICLPNELDHHNAEQVIYKRQKKENFFLSFCV